MFTFVSLCLSPCVTSEMADGFLFAGRFRSVNAKPCLAEICVKLISNTIPKSYSLSFIGYPESQVIEEYSNFLFIGTTSVFPYTQIFVMNNNFMDTKLMNETVFNGSLDIFHTSNATGSAVIFLFCMHNTEHRKTMNVYILQSAHY